DSAILADRAAAADHLERRMPVRMSNRNQLRMLRSLHAARQSGYRRSRRPLYLRLGHGELFAAGQRRRERDEHTCLVAVAANHAARRSTADTAHAQLHDLRLI